MRSGMHIDIWRLELLTTSTDSYDGRAGHTPHGPSWSFITQSFMNYCHQEEAHSWHTFS